MNNIDLKKAWRIRWKKAIFINPLPAVVIMTPNWLKVDKATIFFISISIRAAIPAITIVNVPTKYRYLENGEFKIISLNRTIKYTPAVTKVEECTSEDTGVGAAMAAGSQAEKGICALLVQAAKINKIAAAKGITPTDARSPKDHPPHLLIRARPKRIAQSPSRLVSAVISPALKDFVL